MKNGFNKTSKSPIIGVLEKIDTKPIGPPNREFHCVGTMMIETDESKQATKKWESRIENEKKVKENGR